MAAVQAAVGCITDEVVRASGYRPDAPSLTLVLAGGKPAWLTGGVLALGLDVRHFYRLVEDSNAPRRRRWRVELTGY